jgi:hypothetical protein
VTSGASCGFIVSASSDELDLRHQIIFVARGTVTSISSPTLRPISARPSGEL